MAQEAGNDPVVAVNYKGENPHFKSQDDRMTEWRKSIGDPQTWWSEFAKKQVDWIYPFDNTQIRQGGFEHGDVAWFTGGKLNVSYNCVDRWAKDRPDDIAIIYEGDEPTDVQRITFKQLQMNVCRVANVMKTEGVKKGDNVCVYMPMIPEAAYVMLACARIGAPHSVIFAGFSKDAIRDRILDANCQWVFTADQGRRGGKTIPLKETVDLGLEKVAGLAPGLVKKVWVARRTGADVPMAEGRDVYLDDLMRNARPYCPCEVMDAEDTLFLLYTSGSTGKPKGVVHSTAGYLCYTMATHRYVFDIQPGDVYACVADVGWITGHSYIVYGPLANGATTFMFESTPAYPDYGRYWDMVQRHKITQFYTAPTAIRLLQKWGDDFVNKYDRSSLRVLGTVGEPINPEAWWWYYNVVGEKKCPIVDTYWQTETGGIMITPLPGATPTKPGSATFPFFGVEYAILDKDGKELSGNGVEGILAVKAPWPGMARTVYGNHERYLSTYFTPYPGFYFTGDGARRDKDGYYWITGRVDDVLNIAGHRLGTAEIESTIVEHEQICEAACVGVPDDIKGQAMFAYCVAKEGVELTDALAKEIRMHIRGSVGAFAAPREILIVDAVPKTRSGKVMRRILRKIAACEFKSLGDISTLANADAVQSIVDARQAMPSCPKTNA